MSGTPHPTVAGLGGECLQLDAPTCQRFFGLYQGDFTQCGLVSCPAPLGACCADGCFITARATCESVGGPDLDRRIRGYANHPDREYFVLQGHPAMWSPERFEEFGRILDFLVGQNAVFMTPFGYASAKGAR